MTAKKGARGAAAIAERIVEEDDAAQIADFGKQLGDEKETGATKAARVLGEVATRKPEAVVPLVDRFVQGLTSPHKRVVQTSAEALPAIAKIAPARVAKHLDKLKDAYPAATAIGKDGVVRTFSTLCSASVAYQKRLEPVLKTALGEAEPKTLVAWAKDVLPALKGEPHANARAVVEDRLRTIPKPQAQEIADFLGIRLRHRG